MTEVSGSKGDQLTMHQAIRILSFMLLGWVISIIPIAPAFARAPIKVVFVNPGKTGEVFWDLVSDTMQAAARQLDIELEIVYAERNRRILRERAIAVVNRTEPPDYLVLVNEESAATPVIAVANSAGIKILLLSNAFTDAEAERYGAPRTVLHNWIGSLLPDMHAAGARMARALVDAARRNAAFSTDGKLHLLALAGDEKTPNSLTRLQGFLSVAEKEADVIVDRILYANWNSADAMTLADRYLQWAKGRDIRAAGIWAANDAIALGAIKALDQHGIAPGRETAVVGLNWSPEALDAVADGRMVLTDGGHFLEGGWAMVLLRDHADGCDFAATTTQQQVPLTAIDQEGVPAIAPLIKGKQFDRIRFKQFLARDTGRCGRYDFSLHAVLRAYGQATAR
jgi:ABC-type sugar transport system substrate-binding protein